MKDRLALCRADTIALGQMVRFEIDGMDPLLLVNQDGRFRLIDDDCTHAIASLSEGRLEGDTLFCPMHGGSFDINTGKALSLPCKQPLRTYDVIVDDGIVFLLG